MHVRAAALPPRFTFLRSRPLLAIATVLLVLTGMPSMTAVAAQSDDLPGVDDESYESPTYGYTLEWDGRDWEAVEATADDDDGDTLVLTNEVSTLYISGVPEYRGDAQECSVDVGEVVASRDAADLYPSKSGDTDLDPEDFSYLVDCRELIADEAVLLIVHVLPADELGDELIEAEAVTSTIELGRQGNANEEEEEDDADFADAGVDGNTYESPEFGYTLEWDADIWEVSDATADSDVTFLNLINDGSSLIISGIANMGDPESCLEQAVDFYSTDEGVDDWELLEDEDGEPIEGSTRRRAYAAYSHTAENDDGDVNDYVNYIECRPLEDDAAILISHLMVPDDYEDQSELRDEVLDMLEIP